MSASLVALGHEEVPRGHAPHPSPASGCPACQLYMQTVEATPVLLHQTIQMQEACLADALLETHLLETTQDAWLLAVLGRN